VIVSAISPYREGRDSVRKKIGNFVEVYVKCSLEECTRRDTKGLYKKAITGEITQFTGISDPYEEPLTPEITCNTEIETIEMSVNTVLAGLKRLCFINY
jgi:adenylylsulfate kinase